ncbi:ABC transporter permease subunit [Actinophytocola sp.]|uniref:ABC transporter permease subunit n=1 Tax=Actinophytocola sp. TaxID=1872138 RepID=UPI002ED9E5AC
MTARSTRSVWALAGVAVLACAGWTVADVLAFMTGPDAGQVESAYSMAQQGYLFAMIMGVLVVAGEYRHQTITWALLVTPRRERVIAGKLVACGVLGLLTGLAAVVVTVPVAALLLAGAGYPAWAPGVPVALAGSVLSTLLWTMFGGALGALLRNQVAAIVVAFGWFFYAEWALVALVPAVGRWTPTGAAKAVSGWTPVDVAGPLLPMWAGGLVFLGYTAAAAAVATAVSVRRDVT